MQDWFGTDAGNGRQKHVAIRFSALAILFIALLGMPAFAEESHPGLMAEALYSEAVIAFHRNQIDQAIAALNEVLANAPNYADAIELKALILKQQGKENDAIRQYEKLLKLRPPKERAPYEYELGMIYYRQKHEDLAKHYLGQSLRARFNITVCRFFLGMIAFDQADNRSAEHYFREVAGEAGGEVKLISLYYLGLIELRTSYALGATRDLKAAKKLASELPSNDATRQISASVDQILVPFTKPQWFANATVLGQYNSNISQIPTSLTSSSQSVSGQSTGVLNLSGGVGRMTAPINDFQFVGSYHFSLNLNTNSNTREYQFVTNTVSFFLNYLPLAETQAGFKVEGNFMFQDLQSATDSSSYTYSKYLLGAEVGPYFRYQFSREVQAELDLYFRPQDYYTEPELTGTTVFTRASVRADFLLPYFNPTGYFEYELDNADSTDFKSNTFGLGVADVMKITPRDLVTPGLDLLAANYPQNAEGRQDRQFVVHVDGVHTMNPHFALLANMSYTKNISTESDLYSYTQAIVSFGVSYNL